MVEQRPIVRRGALAAWAVHLFTASGVVLALLAIEAVDDRRWLDAFRWLLAALVVDGIDGTLARSAKVEQRLERIDGTVLDLVIDYLTYVLIPALIIWRAGILPEALALLLTALILVSALYVFARRDMKSDDGYFRGFPALWNVVALYFVLLMPAPATAAAIVSALIVLTFAPIHVPHPFRVRDFGYALPVAAVAWAATTAGLLLPGAGGDLRRLLLGISIATMVVIAAMGLWRTALGGRRSITMKGQAD